MNIFPQTLQKAAVIEAVYEKLIFEPVAELETEFFETDEHLRSVPEHGAWRPAPVGTPWGHAWGNGWFRARFTRPAELDDRPLYLHAPAAGCEALFFVNGQARGIFNATEFRRQRGIHDHLRFYTPGDGAREFEFHLEAYAGHRLVGTQPFDRFETIDSYPEPSSHRFGGLFVTVRNELVKDFVFDLASLNRLSEVLPRDSFRKGKIDRILEEVFVLVPQKPEEYEKSYWLKTLGEARRRMAPLLAAHNSESAPFAGLCGHSHMDTAWLWPVRETIRKCARTWSNVLELMKEYPEYRFVQSSMLHNDFIRREYPELHTRIIDAVRSGRWELVGNAWVEPDCNIISGESLIRQFLRGRRFLRMYADNVKSEVFFLPDTFGYSAALPQILLGCGMRYFLTTKLTWNDTNTFPFDTFRWRGIDGSEVLTHFNDIHCVPDPKTLNEKLHGGGGDFRTTRNYIQHKDVNSMRLITYGFGDGGGGPGYEMLEYARRCRDLEGCPKTEHLSVGDFMKKLESSLENPPVYTGELYFEGHRGTLTSQSAIKRNHRKLELALRDLEIMTFLSGSDPETVRPLIDRLYDVLLLNEFHDILPGTSIPEVHEEAKRTLAAAREEAKTKLAQLASSPSGEGITLWNTLNWERTTLVEVAEFPAGMVPADAGVIAQYTVPRVDGKTVTLLGNLTLPALGAKSVEWIPGERIPVESPFDYDASSRTLETPEFRVKFDAANGIVSLYDRKSEREIVRPDGLPLNALLCGEDVPLAWDNWDIDPDLGKKLHRETRTTPLKVVADGPLEIRLEYEMEIGERSRMRQQIIFRAGERQIGFESQLEWHEKHRFLKAGFELQLLADECRSEIQFGHLRRTVNRNFPFERAKFEICQHKWSDYSENRFGVTLINDCKYGLSAEPEGMYLSLCKSGGHPDDGGDEGVHRMNYALRIHDGGFSAENVVRPAYEYNIPPLVGRGLTASGTKFPVEFDQSNLIVEAIKIAEHGSEPVMRVYECERAAVNAVVRSGKRVRECDMLENELNHPESDHLNFRPFEIKTLKLK